MNGKLKFTEKLGYGLAALSGASNSLLGAFLTMFYTDNIGMAVGAVGTMFMISKLFDGITDLIAGNIVDKTKTKWGKARPWILWLSVPAGLAFALIFMVPQNASPMSQLVYAFLTYNLFSSVIYTMVGVAQTSLLALMTMDGIERGGLARYSMLFGLGGTMLASSVTFPFIAKMGGDTTAWRIVFAIYGFILAAGLMSAFFLTREHVAAVDHNEDGTLNEGTQRLSFIEGVKLFFSNKYCIFGLAITTLMQLALNINSGSQTYFYKYVMEDEMLMTSLSMVGLIPMVVSVLFFAGPCLKYLGKKKSVYFGCGGQLISFAMRVVAGMTANVPLLIAGTVFGGLMTGPVSIPINIITADAIDYGDYKTGKRIEGTASSIGTFAGKISAGLASAITGWTLALTGYVANAVQTSSTRFGITAVFAILPAVIYIVIILAYKLIYHYDKEEPEVVAELTRRREQAAKE